MSFDAASRFEEHRLAQMAANERLLENLVDDENEDDVLCSSRCLKKEA